MLHEAGTKVAKVLTPTEEAMQAKVSIDYTNYRGERATRVVVPSRIWHGATEWHPECQWLMTAWDVDKNAWRTFALKDIHSWDEN